jgi:hypothetical protein
VRNDIIGDSFRKKKKKPNLIALFEKDVKGPSIWKFDNHDGSMRMTVAWMDSKGTFKSTRRQCVTETQWEVLIFNTNSNGDNTSRNLCTFFSTLIILREIYVICSTCIRTCFLSHNHQGINTF